SRVCSSGTGRGLRSVMSLLNGSAAPKFRRTDPKLLSRCRRSNDDHGKSVSRRDAEARRELPEPLRVSASLRETILSPYCTSDASVATQRPPCTDTPGGWRNSQVD